MADFAQILIRAKDDTKGAFDSATRNLRGLEGAASKLNGALGTIGLGAGLSAAGLAAFAKQGIDAADALGDLSARTGVSVKTLAEWKLAAEQSDTSIESLGKGVQKLALSIGQAEAGSKEQAAALQRLGITAREPKAAFEQLANAVAKSNDPIRTNADLQAVLGKSYSELLPLLQGGSRALEDSAVASASFAEAMEKLAPDADMLNDQIAELKTSASGLAATILAEVVPSFNEWIAVGKEVSENGSWLDKLRFFALGNASDDIVERVRKLREAAAEARKAEEEAARARNQDGNINTSLDTKPHKARTKSEADPLANLLDQTASARAAEYDKLLGLLEKRMADGKIKADQYGEAVAVLNKQFSREAIDPLGSGSFSTASEEVAEFIRKQQEAINGLNGEMAQDGVRAAQEYESALASLISDTTVSKTAELKGNVDLLDRAFFEGKISVEQYEQALEKLLNGKTEETKSLAKDLGLTFSSAFEDAMVSGARLSEVLKGIEADIIRILARKAVTEPLMDFAKDFNWGGLFASANGNVFMNSPGLSAYSGSIVSQPTLFPFATGMGLMGEAGPEAILPLKRGSDGKLGVVAGSSGGVGVVVTVNNNVSGTQAMATERTGDNGVRMIDVMVEQVEGAMSRRLGRGEGIAPSMERRYGLNPVAGAY